MKKIIITVLFVAILAGLAALVYQKFKLTSSLSQAPVVIPQAGLFVDSPIGYAVVSSPLVVSGYIDGTNRWTGFEGQVGTVRLLDGNGNELTMGILTATTDWMQFPTNFSTTLTFSAPATVTGTLVFRNENASGMPERDRKFILPVRF